MIHRRPGSNWAALSLLGSARIYSEGESLRKWYVPPVADFKKCGLTVQSAPRCKNVIDRSALEYFSSNMDSLI